MHIFFHRSLILRSQQSRIELVTRPGVLKSKSEEEVNIFRTYLERKLESDTLEDEARSKNLSLNEIEEQRTLRSGRKGRRKGKQIKKVRDTYEALLHLLAQTK